MGRVFARANVPSPYWDNLLSAAFVLILLLLHPCMNINGAERETVEKIKVRSNKREMRKSKGYEGPREKGKNSDSIQSIEMKEIFPDKPLVMTLLFPSEANLWQFYLDQTMVIL